MHLHDNSARVWDRVPLRCRPGETFAFEGKSVDLGAIVAAIAIAPDDFEFAAVAIIDFATQIKGQTKLNFHHVASMSRRDARRPLLIARLDDGALQLLDGRHRAARCKQLGYETSEAWILTPAQWAGFVS